MRLQHLTASSAVVVPQPVSRTASTGRGVAVTEELIFEGSCWASIKNVAFEEGDHGVLSFNRATGLYRLSLKSNFTLDFSRDDITSVVVKPRHGGEDFLRIDTKSKENEYIIGLLNPSSSAKEHFKPVMVAPVSAPQPVSPRVSGYPPTTMSGISRQNVKYCQECGAANDVGVTYCLSCGAMNFGSMAPARVSRPTGVLILGIIQIVGSLIVLFISSLISFALTPFLGPLALIIYPFAILPLLFAIALFTGSDWARILMLVGAVLDIISVAGIIWGVLLLWYLTRPRVVAYYKQPK